MRWIVGLGTVAFAGLAVASPSSAAWLAAKEGPLEHLGHGLLAAALIAWSVAAIRARPAGGGWPRWVYAGLVLTVVVLLGEELDWGAVYGWMPLAERLQAATGRANLHNAWSGASYLVFAVLPLVTVGAVGWARGEHPGRLPRRSDAVGVVWLGVGSLAATIAWPAGEPQVDEVAETLLYLGVLWMAIRPAAEEAGRAGEPTTRGGVAR